MSSNNSLVYYNKALRMIKAVDSDYAKLSEFVNSNVIIDEAEENLKIKFPSSYRIFLQDVGYLTTTEATNEENTLPEILGIPEWGFEEIYFLNVVSKTLDFRKRGLAQPLVYIYNLDDWKYFLDTSRMDENGECPVIVLENWFLPESKLSEAEIAAPNFGEFLYRVVLNYLDPDEFERQGLTY